MYCFIFALWPVHTTNLSVLNGMGRSDLFFKLEIIKKILGFSILCMTVFAFHSPVAIVAGFMVSGVVSTLINAFPNRTVIGYGYGEQVADIAPVWALSLISGLTGLFFLEFLATFSFSLFLQVFLTGCVFCEAFVLLGIVFQCEALSYVLTNGVKLVRTLTCRRGK